LVVVSVLIILNLFTFLAAYPQTLTTSPLPSGQGGARLLAKDFCAYYVGAWRLIHDPAQVYTQGFVDDGEPAFYPRTEQYKYLPSFLLIICPILLVTYQHAFAIFDVFQFLLLPLVAYMTYKLINKKGVAVTLIVSIIVLLEPSPIPHWSFSVPYYWQWKDGQAKVLETFLILLSFYFGSIGKPKLSGGVLALSMFDPRFVLFALPLFTTYNKDRILASVTTLLGTLILSNLVLLYPDLGMGFMAMVFSTGMTAIFYPYALIPLFTVLSISIVNGKEIFAAARELSSHKSA
jgi:hypothetical protein